MSPRQSTPAIACDRSMRSIDADGHMKVEQSVITRACVSDYVGREIPDYVALGLQPDKVYKLLRDPAELAKAAESFTGKPILLRHMPISAAEPRKDLVVGSVGTVTFEDGALIARPLVIWDGAAIKLIESEQQRELSCGYRYVADMSPGVYEGRAFDGVMRGLAAQHIALVETARVPGALVADQIPEEFKAMKNRTAAAVAQTIAPYLAPDADRKTLALALDAALALDEALEEAEAAERAEDKACDYYENSAEDWAAMSAEDRKSARDKWRKARDAKRAKDSEVDHRNDFKGAADGETIRKQMRAAFAARESVKSLVGIIALDAAGMDTDTAIYAFALKQAGIKDVETIHSSAYPAMIDLLKSRKGAAALALDAAKYIPLAHVVANVWPTARGRAS